MVFLNGCVLGADSPIHLMVAFENYPSEDSLPEPEPESALKHLHGRGAHASAIILQQVRECVDEVRLLHPLSKKGIDGQSLFSDEPVSDEQMMDEICRAHDSLTRGVEAYEAAFSAFKSVELDESGTEATRQKNEIRARRKESLREKKAVLQRRLTIACLLVDQVRERGEFKVSEYAAGLNAEIQRFQDMNPDFAEGQIDPINEPPEETED